MSTKKILVSQLRQGMFIHELDISWMKSPFLRHRRQIKTTNDILLLKKAGVRELHIDLSRGDDVQQTVESSTGKNEQNNVSQEEKSDSPEPDDSPELHKRLDEKPEKQAELNKELKVAKVLQGKISKLVSQLGSLIKDSRPISAETISPIIKEALESISRNDQALLTLLHIQRQDLKLSDHGFGVFAVILPLALQLGCTDEEVNELGMAALLHDMGWTRLPMNLFGKKKTYTASEKQLVKQHPNIVVSVLNKSKDFPETVKTLIKQHHEFNDGSGFPEQLKKGKIHKLVEILQVADSYDEYIHGLTDQQGMLPANALKKIYQAARSGLYSETIVSEMIHVMGIFPLTSAIELDNGEKALVVEIDKKMPLLPRVKIIYEADGQPCQTEVFRDLANQEEGENIRVIKVIDPLDDKHDPLGLLRVDSV